MNDMNISREYKLIGYLLGGLLAARAIVLIMDAVAETLERRALYR